jgi:hypothetical protein
MADNLPKPIGPTGRSLDRAQLERVLARATELQAGTSDASESMTEEQLIELGKEVGLSPEHLRQAIAEEQTRVVVAGSDARTSGIFGPAIASTQRVIAGTQADVLARIDKHMQTQEELRVRRRYGERITWEARRDFVGDLKRGFRLGGSYALARADETGASVVPVDANRVLVRLDASFTQSRSRSVIGGGALAGTGVVGAGGLITIAAASAGSSMPIALLIAGVWAALGGAGFAAFAKTYRSSVERAQLALEQILDRLEHGEPGARRPASIFDVLSSVLNR